MLNRNICALIMLAGSFSVVAQEGAEIDTDPSTAIEQAGDSDLAAQLEELIETEGSLEEAIKVLSEQNPSQVNEIVALAVTLYPDSAQSIVNAVVVTGTISANDAVIAALDAGADPTTVTGATASGGAAAPGGAPAGGAPAPAAPVGGGAGAGGSGGGGVTASTN